VAAALAVSASEDDSYVPRQDNMSNAYCSIAMAATSVAIEHDGRCPILYSDSGASETIINDKRLGRNFRRLNTPRRFAGAVSHDGTQTIMTAHFECEVLSFGLGLFSEEATVNLISEGALQRRGWTIKTIGREERHITDPHGRVFRLRRNGNNMYPFVVDPTQLANSTADSEEDYDPPAAALALVNGTFMSRKELAACDEIEALHLRFNHVNDADLATLLDHSGLKGAEHLSGATVRANRLARGACPGCQPGKFVERPRPPSKSAAPSALTGRAHADLIPLGHLINEVKGGQRLPSGLGYLFFAKDAHTGFGTVYWQPTKSTADCVTSLRQLHLHYKRNTHILREVATDADRPLMRAADLAESTLPGLRIRHSAPEDYEVDAERMWRTIVGDATCTLAQLPYTLPLQYYKYLFQYVVDCRNNIPNNHTTPLTPAIIFAGQRASARGLPFGTTAMVRVGKDKRAAFGLLAAKAELGVYLGGLMRQDAGRWLLANGSVVARSDRAIRLRDVSTPFGWKAKDSIAPTRLLDSALKAPGYVYIPGAPNETTLPTTAPSDLNDEFVDNMAPAEPHDSVKQPNTHPPAQTVPQRVDPAPRMAETMQMDRQPQAIPAPAVHPSEGEDHVNPSEGITPTVVPPAIPAPAVHPSEGEDHVSPSEGITPTVVPSEGATPPSPDPPVPRHLAPDNVEPQPERRYPSRYTGPSVLDRKQQEELLADAARQQRAPFVSRKPTRPPQFNPHASLFLAQKTAQQVGSIFRATQLSRKKAMTTRYAHTVAAAVQREFSKMEKLQAGPLMNKGFKVPEGIAILPSFGFVTFKTDALGRYAKTNYRLVPNGKRQNPASIGETYSATIRLDSKLMAASAFAAAHKAMKLLVFDITGAFLQCPWTGGELYIRLPADIPQEVSYMGQTNLAGRVVKVTKAWYGLKESNRIFSEDLKTTLASIDYAPTIMDSQVYLPTSRRHGDSAILMHVDDGAFCYTHDKQAERLLNKLRSRYGHDLSVTYGTIDTPLNHAGHVFVLREDHLEVNQLPHIQNCVEEILGTNHSSIRSRLTPSSMDLFTVDKTATPIDIERYRKRVGMLLYLQTCFDITKEINYLAAHVTAPTSDHEAKMFKVAQYLKGRITSGITLKFPLGCTIRLTAWADASFRVHPGARSQYGAMVAINPNAAPFWVSCGKLPGVPVSAYEAEYVAAFKACQRTEYFRQFLRVLAPILRSPELGPVLFRDDNQAVIKLTAAPDIPKRSRHIDVKYHFVRHLAKARHIELMYLKTDLMTADIFTKPLGPTRFRFLRDRLLGITTMGGDKLE